MKIAVLLTLFFSTVLASLAQAPAAATSTNPVVNVIRSLEERQSKNLIAAAEEMPADKYSYKPTPDQISFAHLMVHVAESNNSLCSKISGEKRNVDINDKQPKEELSKAVQDSFSFCKKVLDNASDGNLAEPMEIFAGRSGTRATAFIALATGWADHYGAAAMYLRLNGLLPPSAKK